MANEIRNLEIFATGTHNAQTGKLNVTDEDLDRIVDAFNSLQGSNKVRPHLKLGHTDAQKWFGQKDGIPSLGWINRVWRQGPKLLADIIDVPDALMDMIRAKRYHNVSAEVFWDAPIEHNGRRFSRVLSAVALLGVEMPAVKDLAGLASALFRDGPIHEFSESQAVELQATTEETTMPKEGEDKLLYNQQQHDSLVEAAVAKAVREAEAKFAEEKKALETERDTLLQRAEQAENTITEVRAAAAKEQANTLVDQAIKDGKLLPKQKDFALAALSSTATKVKFGDKGEEKTMAELFKDFLESQGKVIDTSEKGDGTTKRTEFSTPAEEVDHEVRAFMNKNADKKIDYAQAMDTVLASDPDLKSRYLNAQV